MGEPPRHQTLIPLFEELRGARVVLRPYCLDDAAPLFEAIDESREHLSTFLSWVKDHQTVDDTRDFIVRAQANWLLRQELHVGIWEAATGHCLGGTGYYHMGDASMWDVGSFEIGYWLRASAEGQGYMTETARLLTDYAFEALGANRVEINCDARNVRSAAVPRRLGFVLEGWLRNQILASDGTVSDRLVFALTRLEWRPLADH